MKDLFVAHEFSDLKNVFSTLILIKIEILVLILRSLQKLFVSFLCYCYHFITFFYMIVVKFKLLVIEFMLFLSKFIVMFNIMFIHEKEIS